MLLYEMLAGRLPFDIMGTAENPDHNTEDFLFQVIMEKTIRIPRSISVKAQSVLKGFLKKNPVERLGCHSETGFLDICSHPFFKTIDWEKVSVYISLVSLIILLNVYVYLKVAHTVEISELVVEVAG